MDNGMRVLITGGAGFIGSNFIRRFVADNPDSEVVVLDKLTYAGRQENLTGIPTDITFVLGDITKPEDLRAAGRCDAIINFAAETHVDRSLDHAPDFALSNFYGTCTLLEFARKKEVSRFIQISTDEVYGSREQGCFSEPDRLNPSSPYSASKSGADLLALAYHRTYGLPVMITRSTNNFGPYQYPEKLIPLLILRAIRDEPLPIYGNGKNVRDWIYVEDNCTAIANVFDKGTPGTIYNIGAGNELSNIEIARYILGTLRKSPDLIRFVPDRPGHDFRYAVTTDRIRALGWKPAFPFEEGLRKTIAWYRDHEPWWRPLISPSS